MFSVKCVMSKPGCVAILLWHNKWTTYLLNMANDVYNVRVKAFAHMDIKLYRLFLKCRKRINHIHDIIIINLTKYLDHENIINTLLNYKWIVYIHNTNNLSNFSNSLNLLLALLSWLNFHLKEMPCLKHKQWDMRNNTNTLQWSLVYPELIYLQTPQSGWFSRERKKRNIILHHLTGNPWFRNWSAVWGTKPHYYYADNDSESTNYIIHLNINYKHNHKQSVYI